MKQNTNTQVEAVEPLKVSKQLGTDVKNSIFVVSIVANLFFFILWITLQVTTQYNAQVASWLLNH